MYGDSKMTKAREKAVELVKRLFESAEASIPKMDEISKEAEEGYRRQAEAFTRKALDLMRKFNIQKHELLESGTNSNKDILGLGIVDYTCFKTLWSKNSQEWFTVLCAAVSVICSVKIQIHPERRFDTCCRIFATDEDSAEAAKDMLDGFLRMANLFYNTLRKNNNKLKRADYLLGFAKAVFDKANEPVSNDNQEQALVRISESLTKKVEDLINSLADNRNLKAEKVNVTKQVDASSFHHGYHDGSNKDNARLSNTGEK